MSLHLSQVPTTPSCDYMLHSPAAAAASKPSNRDGLVVYCMDVSGSMCVTTEVKQLQGMPGAEYTSLLWTRDSMAMPCFTAASLVIVILLAS